MDELLYLTRRPLSPARRESSESHAIDRALNVINVYQCISSSGDSQKPRVKVHAGTPILVARTVIFRRSLEFNSVPSSPPGALQYWPTCHGQPSANRAITISVEGGVGSLLYRVSLAVLLPE